MEIPFRAFLVGREIPSAFLDALPCGAFFISFGRLLPPLLGPTSVTGGWEGYWELVVAGY